MTKKAVIILSGGLDSTTALAIAQQQGFECHALSFDYGQRMQWEITAAKQVAKHHQVASHKIFKLPLAELGGSALTDTSIDVPDYEDSKDIPITYVPGRNTLFFAYALSYAESIQAFAVFSGITSIEYSNYPDCVPEYMAAIQRVFDLAVKVSVTKKSIQLHTPLLYLDKKQIILEGLKLGVDYGLTVSCYQVNDRGEACGRCDSCQQRKQGFRSLQVDDPTRYVDEQAKTIILGQPST